MNEPCARIALDVQQASTAAFVAVKRGDIGRKIVISLSDSGFPYEITEDCYAVLTGTKPDGNILYNHCDIEGNTIVYEITEQTTAAAGRIKAEVKLYSAEDALVTSATFRIIVDGTVYVDDQVESSSEFTALADLVQQVLTLRNEGIVDEEEVRSIIEEIVGSLDGLETKDKTTIVNAINALQRAIGSAGGDAAGLSSAASALLVTILRNGVYSSDQSANITALAAELGVAESGEDTHAHSYTSSVTTAATCTTAGVRTYTCSCGESYTESIPATGHNYVDGVCTVCGAADPDYSEEVTLTGISAAYSGGDVTVGTAVTDLTGIVVTAEYSDGSSNTVNGYTLSGTIAEGSNTVTVSYGGKTATFTVTGVAESSGGEEVAVAMVAPVALSIPGTAVYWYQDNLDTAKLDDVTAIKSVTGSAFSWFSDGGTTEFTTGFSGRTIPCMTSQNVFVEDTEVKVLIKTGGAQHYDNYVVGCTDWDGISTPSENAAYNCQSIGGNNWTSVVDHEITLTVKAGTRVFVASHTSTKHRVEIFNPTAVINTVNVSDNAAKYITISENVFDADTQIRIAASKSTNEYDMYVVGCTNADSVVNNIDVFFVQTGGSGGWVTPYSIEETYTVKAGYKLLFGSYWNPTAADSFTVTEVG